MATSKVVLKTPQVSVNGNDCTDQVQEVAITYEAEQKEFTNASSAGAKEFTPGLLGWTMEVSFLQSFASGNIDSIIFALMGVDAFPLIIRPTEDAISATNPAYTGNAILPSYNPIQGKIGDVLVTKIKFQGSGVLTRDVTP